MYAAELRTLAVLAGALKSGKQLLMAAITVSNFKSPWVFAVTIALWSSDNPEEWRQIQPRASVGKSTLTFLLHFVNTSWTLDVQATIDSPSVEVIWKTSRKHSIIQSCFCLSGNLSSSAVQMWLSPLVSVRVSKDKCSTDSSARPSKRQ